MTFLLQFITSALFISILTGTQAEAQIVPKAASQTSLDWDAVNSSFVTIVDEHTMTYDFLESGLVLVDKSKSNLSEGNFNVGFNFESTDLDLLSSMTPQKMSLVGSIGIRTTADTGSFKRVDFDVSIELQSDVLLVLNHVNQLFSECPAQDLTDLFEVELCKYIEGVENATEVVELKSALESLKNALVLLLPAGPPTNTIEDQLFLIIRQLNVVQQANSVLVSTVANGIDLFGMELSGDVRLNFTDTGIKLQVIGATLLSSSDYDLYLNELEKSLLGIQQKDANTFDILYSYTFGVFDLLEGIFL